MATEKRLSEVRPAKTTATATLADTAYVWGIVTGSNAPLEDLLEGLRGRLEALRDPLSPEAIAELQRQLPVLEGLFLRFAAEAANTGKSSENRSLLIRAALQAQQGYTRTFALLHTLTAQTKNAVTPTIELHDDSREDD